MARSPATTSPPTRSWATGVEYHLRYQRLRERAAAAGIGPDDHLGFARWLIGEKSRAQPAYWRKLKAAALAGLDLEGAATAREAEALLRAETSAGTARGAPRRAPRRKTVTPDEMRLLLENLTRRALTSEVGRLTVVWLIAGHATGLRPCEWRSAVLASDANGRPVLRVENAKQTNGRAHGNTRALALDELRPQEREVHNTASAGHRRASGGIRPPAPGGCRPAESGQSAALAAAARTHRPVQCAAPVRG